MHIVTVDDHDFPALLELFQRSKSVGQFAKDGRIQLVRANKRLLMICSSGAPGEIAIRPVRSETEALRIARELIAGQNSL